VLGVKSWAMVAGWDTVRALEVTGPSGGTKRAAFQGKEVKQKDLISWLFLMRRHH
jgi:hypothetical protein